MCQVPGWTGTKDTKATGCGPALTGSHWLAAG